MKKLLFLSTMLSLSLISCGDDDQNNQDQDPLIGKWNIVKSEIYENGTLTDSENLKPGSCDYNYYELKTGGVKNEVYHNEQNNCATQNYEGVWLYNSSNKQITLIDSEDNYTLVVEMISVNATDLKVKMISDGGETPEEGEEVYLYLKK